MKQKSNENHENSTILDNAKGRNSTKMDKKSEQGLIASGQNPTNTDEMGERGLIIKGQNSTNPDANSTKLVENGGQVLQNSTKKAETKNRSAIALCMTHTFNNVITVFVTTFLISYIYSISENYVLNIGLFYFFNYLFMAIFYIIISKVVDKTNRITFYRLAIIFRAIFILLVVFLGKELAELVVFAGALHGFSEAFYWTSYNIMKNELVHQSEAKNFSRNQYLIEYFVNIVVPITLGTLIDAESFKTSLIIILMIATIQLVVSIFIKSKRPENSSFDFKDFVTKTKNLGAKKVLVKNVILNGICDGIITIISPLATILIMTKFNSNFSLGLLTSVFAVCAMIMIMFISKKTHTGKRGVLFFVTGILPVIFTIIMLVWTGEITVILFYFFYMTCKVVYAYTFDVTRNLAIKKLGMFDCIAEYQMSVELSLEFGRIVAFGLMSVVGFIGATFGTDGILIATKVLLGVFIFIFPIFHFLIHKYEKKFKSFEV